MKSFIREYGQETYTANQLKTIILPRDYAQNDIEIELVTDITIAGGTTSGTLTDYSPASLIQNISIRANGSDVIKSFTMQDIVIQTFLRYGVLPNNNGLLVNGDAQANTISYVYGRIDFSMFRSIKPYDTLFNSQRLTSFEALIQWGSASSIYADVKGDRTTTINSATVTLSGKEAVGVSRELAIPVLKESTQESVADVTTAEKKISLHYANDLSYRQIVLLAKDDGVLSNGIINNIKLQSGGVVFVNINGRRLRNRNKTVLGIDTFPTGVYVLDFCEDGRVNDALDTAGLSSLDLVLDVTHVATTSIIRVITNEIITPTIQK